MSEREFEPRLLTIGEMAERMQVSKRTVYRIIARGELEVVYAGARMRVLEWSFRAYLARNDAAPAAERGT